MKIKQPKAWVGPFVSQKYNKRAGNLYLKNESGKYTLIENVTPAMFVLKYYNDKMPVKRLNNYITKIREEGQYYRYSLVPDINRTDIDDILDICHESSVYPFEADVSAPRRWFSDTGTNISQNQKTLFFDLESVPDPKFPGFEDEAKKRHKLLSFCAEDMNGNNWFEINPKFDSPLGELYLLEKFLDIAKNYDTLLAWNGNDYDFFVLKERAKYLEHRIDWRNWNLLDHMVLVKKCLSSISDPSFKQSFALDNIGRNVLGIEKLRVDVPMTRLDLLLGGREKKLEAYNKRDVEIMIKLEKKREFVELHLAVCALCNHFPDRNSLYPNSLTDGLMLRLAINENKHFRSRRSDMEGIIKKEFKGGYVKDPEVGFHKDVRIIDFSSLYPSIMISWNMSPDTKIHKDRNYPRNVLEKDYAYARANGVKFRTDFIGMIPKALKILISKRKEYSKKQKEANVGTDLWRRYGNESTAIKIVANSIYGLMGSKYTRYYDVDIAQSVTLTGQFLIKEVAKYAEDKKFHVIGGDTDSIFIKSSDVGIRSLIKDINNDLIYRITKESGCKENLISIDYDKAYHYLLIQAKKKYAGILSIHKGREAPPNMISITGLEFKRSEICKYAQRFQKYMLKFLLDPNIIPTVVESEIQKYADEFLHEDILQSDIEIFQGVKKDPSLYTSPGPVVRVAKQMIRDGKEFYCGMKVPYIVVASHNGIKAIHADDYNKNFDRLYYWKHKILPPVTRLLEARFPGYLFDRLPTLVTNPDQGSFDFVDYNPNKLKLPKTKKIKTVYITIPRKNGKQIICGVSKLMNEEEGVIPINLLINTDDAIVDIDTKQKTSIECIKMIKKCFSTVQISNKSI